MTPLAPLFAFLFDAPILAGLTAAGAVAVPIVIHLLNRRRFKIVEWAAMRFLLQAQQKNSRKMRIEQLLLLLVRCLVVALLVAGMASVTPWAEAAWRWLNPEGGKGVVAGSTRVHRIIVLDGSYSMSVKAGDRTCFDRAKEMAVKVVEEGAGNDGFSVVLMADPPRRIVPEPSEDARKVTAEIRALKMTHGTADLAGTLSTVAGLLRSSPEKFPGKEVYFLTDMQRSGWISPRPGDLAAALQTFSELKAKALFVDVGRDGVNNLAVTGLELGEPVATTQGKMPILATLFNHGENRDDAVVRLFVGKAKTDNNDRPLQMREVAGTSAKVRRGQQQTVSFAYQFPTPGDYVVQVQVGGDDIELDDTRSAVVRVRNDVKVMMVNGKSTGDPFDQAAVWPATALNPYEKGREPPGAVFRPDIRTLSEFRDEGKGDLTDYDVVVLCDVPLLNRTEVRRLEAHVRRGGAVVVGLGAGVDLGNYNDQLHRGGEGLLPARLIGPQKATPGYVFQLAMDPEADRLDPLRVFGDSAAREQLLSPHFSAFIQSEPSRAVRGVVPRKILGFAPLALPARTGAPRGAAPTGGPAVLEWTPPLPGPAAPREGDTARNVAAVTPGRGKVALVTTTLNADWNRWAPSRAYPAFLQELLFFAASARLRERALGVGEPIEVYLNDPAAVDAVVEVPRDPYDPAGEGEDATRRLSSKPFADGGVLRFGETETSGVYKMRIGRHPREHAYAVNVPTVTDDQRGSESNPARVPEDELQRAYPELDMQVVTELRNVKHVQAQSVSTGETVYAPQGGGIAHWILLGVLLLVLVEVVLAWQFGHYSGVAALTHEKPVAPPPAWQAWTLACVPWLLFALVGATLLVLAHNAVTGDFLGFLPESARQLVERAMNVPAPAAGEGSRWRLEFGKVFGDAKSDPWLLGTIALAVLVGVGFVYRREGPGKGATADRPDAVRVGPRALLTALRFALVLLLLLVFLPQLKLHFERQGWPDVVLLIDDSQSMSAYDVYREDKVKAAVDALAGRAELTDDEKTELARALALRAGLTKASRLRLAQTFLTADGNEYLTTLLTKRRVRLHVYRCSARAQRVADATREEEVPKAVEAIRAMRAEPANDSSQLGTAVRQVLNDFRGASLSAVVLVTDGVTTEGESLSGVSKYAAQMGVPLFFVGVGDSQEQRDVYLHDLQCEDAVYVNDRIIFELKLTAQGYTGLNVPVTLHEKGKDKELTRQMVTVDAGTRTVKVRLIHRPTEPGEKTFVIRVPVQEGEIDKENNVIERTIQVREAKQIKVLYVEGYRRYEFHYLKTLLERESNRLKGNKSVNLKLYLVDADPDFHKEDRTAIPNFPTPFRTVDLHTRDDDLWSYDVVILGDVDPERGGDGRMNENFKNLADFVRERGGGLLVLGGERFNPKAYRNSPLRDILPIDITDEKAAEGDPEDGIIENYRLELTGVGRMHPLFRFSPDEKDNEEIWNKLKEFYWFADGYVPKRAAEVLATHPSLKGIRARGEKHPLLLQHFAGAGRCMFFGFNETWRWNWREDQIHYNQFWIQAVRYLARTRIGRIELRLDRQTPYRRGEPIKVMVRFPDDEKPPAEKTEVRVVVERRVPGKPAEKDTRTLQLSPLEGSRGTFETILTQTPEGEYRFWLAEPAAKPRPQAECKVLAPPGEMELLRMNQAEMEQAAILTQGKFYTPDTAERLIDDLPAGNRVTVNSAGPPMILWNSALLFVLALGLVTTEWLVRKRKNLL